MPSTIVIIGAGLAGSLLASFLARRGHRVRVYERRPDPRTAGFVGGRSINLALSTRGIHALSQVDLAERVLGDAIPMRGRMMHAVSGELTFQPYSKNADEAINSVSRAGLNVALLDAAEAAGDVEVFFECRCLEVDLEGGTARLAGPDGQIDAQGDLLIGADGAFSAVRGAMQRTDRFTYHQTYLEHGYKELTIPPRDGDFALDPNALHIWPRGGSMMIALPNRDRSFTCTLFWPFDGSGGLHTVDGDDAVRAHFERTYGDAVPLMPTLLEDYARNPIGSLVTIRCHPWHRGRALLIGDAAHAIVPFYGQGMNAGFEDCTVLDACIDEHGDDWARVLDSFTRRRRDDADAIADLAMVNFIEMRDRVGSRLFLLRKKVEKKLHAWFPGRYLPLYNMVTFSRIPYAEARRRAARQDRTVLVIASLLALALVAIVVVLLIILF